MGITNSCREYTHPRDEFKSYPKGQSEKHMCWCLCTHPHLFGELGPKTRLFQDLCLICPLLCWSVAEPDAATTAAEHVALQRLSAGPFHSIPSALLQRGRACGLKIDVDGGHLTSKAARFRVASQSAVLSTGMNRICAGNDHCCRNLDSFARSWDDMYPVSSTAHFTTSAFQLVIRMDSLRSLRDLPFHKMQ